MSYAKSPSRSTASSSVPKGRITVAKTTAQPKKTTPAQTGQTKKTGSASAVRKAAVPSPSSSRPSSSKVGGGAKPSSASSKSAPRASPLTIAPTVAPSAAPANVAVLQADPRPDYTQDDMAAPAIAAVSGSVPKSPRGILKTCSYPSCFNHRAKGSPYCVDHVNASASSSAPSVVESEPESDSKEEKTADEEPPPYPEPEAESVEESAHDEAEADLRCSACGEGFPPGTSYITALGGTYHPDHFKCHACQKSLAESETPVYSFDGNPYCEVDYLSKFAKRCSRCSKDIIGKFFRALDRDWHEACLVCSQCKAPLVNKPIYHKTTGDSGQPYHDGDEIYCEDDYQSLYGENCAACGKLLSGKILKALDDKWHPECFCCAECQDPLGTTFFVENNNVYCRKDFEQLFATRCAGCKEIVSGPCLKALDKTFHRECFLCSHCKTPLQTDKFYQEGDDVYCLKDYEELYAVHCAGCSELVTGTVLHVLDKDWHKDCFVCAECKTPLTEGFLKRDDKVYCEKDYSRLFDVQCAGCGEVLTGGYVEVLGFTWHRTCFLCTTCLAPIAGDACFVQDNRVYCADDFRKLLLSQGHAGDIDEAASAGPDQNAADKNRDNLVYDKFAKLPRSTVGLEEEKDKASKSHGARFSRMVKMPSKARLLIKSSELSVIPEENVRSHRGEFDLGVCLAAGIEATLASKKRIFRSDYRDKSIYKPLVEAGVFDFCDYAPCVFQAIRQNFGINIDSYRDALCSKGNLLGAKLAGPAAAQIPPFFFSRDKRFLLKAITPDEEAFLLKILERYFRHITRHPHTLLPRFYGLHQIRVPTKSGGTGKKAITFLVMNNIFDTTLPIHHKFEFKGTNVNRYVDDKEIKQMMKDGGPGFVPVLKDLNFKSKIYVHPEDAHTLKQQIGRDVSFLRTCDIMNHSLLLGIHKGATLPAKFIEPSNAQMLLKGLLPGQPPHPLVSVFQRDEGGIRGYDEKHPERRKDLYFIGIVDILQEFSMRKNIRLNRKNVSSSESKKYNIQFEKYMRELVA